MEKPMSFTVEVVYLKTMWINENVYLILKKFYTNRLHINLRNWQKYL